MSEPLTEEQEAAIYQAQVMEFKHLGFTETEADLLASADAHPFVAMDMLKNGCSHQLAVRILI